MLRCRLECLFSVTLLPGVPVGRGMRVAGGTLTMNGTFAAAVAASGDEGEARAQAAPAPAALTGFLRGKAEFDRFDHMAGLGGSCLPRHILRFSILFSRIKRHHMNVGFFHHTTSYDVGLSPHLKLSLLEFNDIV